MPEYYPGGFESLPHAANRNKNTFIILEDMLQCKLFNRSQKGVTLTDEGRILFRQINRPCQQMGRAEELLKEYTNSQSGKVSIGASELTMRFFLLPYIGTIPAAFSECDRADSFQLCADHRFFLKGRGK